MLARIKGSDEAGECIGLNYGSNSVVIINYGSRTEEVPLLNTEVNIDVDWFSTDLAILAGKVVVSDVGNIFINRVIRKREPLVEKKIQNLIDKIKK